MNLVKKIIFRPFHRSILKAALLIVIGALLRRYSERWGDMLMYFAYGSLFVIWYYVFRIKHRIATGCKIEQTDEDHFLISTTDGVEISVPKSHKNLFISRDASNNEINEALFVLGPVSCVKKS